MTCSGDSSQSCGGPNRITVFNSTTLVQQPGNPSIPGYAYAGCYTDSVGARSLNDDYMFDSAMTVEKCATRCNGSKYFGMEYGGECYCGAAFANPSTKVADAECSMLCGGSTMEFCGAGNRLTVYEKDS